MTIPIGTIVFCLICIAIDSMVADVQHRIKYGNRKFVCWYSAFSAAFVVASFSLLSLGKVAYAKPANQARDDNRINFSDTSIVRVQVNNVHEERGHLEMARQLVVEATKNTGRSGMNDEYAFRQKDGTVVWRKINAGLH